MTHLHVPDGVLPAWLVAVSLLVGGAAVLLVLRFAPGRDRVRFLARVGVAAAALTAALSLPLGAAHLSLAPLAGMILGPGGGFLAAFLANGTVAAVGHGGITAVGVNGLFLGLQAVLGALLFLPLRRLLGVRWGGSVAAGLTLALASAAAILALRALPLEPDHLEHGTWGPWVVGAMALAVTLFEAHLTGSVLRFLSAVRGDLVQGSGAPPAPAVEVPA